MICKVFLSTVTQLHHTYDCNLINTYILTTIINYLLQSGYSDYANIINWRTSHSITCINSYVLIKLGVFQSSLFEPSMLV